MVPIFNYDMLHLKKHLEVTSLGEKWLLDFFQHHCDHSIRSTDPLTCKTTPRMDGIEDSYIMSESEVIQQIFCVMMVPSDTPLFCLKKGRYQICKNIKIPSLTKVCFQGYLQQICEYINITNELQAFYADLFPAQHRSYLTTNPPFTYEAYVRPVITFLEDFKTFLRKEEIIFLRQESCTLLSLLQKLTEKLRLLKIMYKIHLKATQFDWKTSPNWICATCLLSVLYEEISSSWSGSITAFLITLFLESFQPYMYIISTWLEEGELTDHRKEFFIIRSPAKSTVTSGIQTSGLAVCPYEKILTAIGIRPARLLQDITNMILKTGENVEFLLKLERLSPVISHETDNIGGKVFNKFLQNVHNKLCHFVDDSCLSETDDSFSHQTDEDKIGPDEDVTTFSALGSVFQRDSYTYRRLASVKSTESSVSMFLRELTMEEPELILANDKIMARLVRWVSESMVPVCAVMMQELKFLMNEKYVSSCAAVVEVFGNHLRLYEHFRLMQAVYFLEAGSVLEPFYDCFFNSAFQEPFQLTECLQMCLKAINMEQAERMHLTVPTQEAMALPLPYLLNTVVLSYDVEWPFDLVFNESTLSMYNRIFCFLLKLKWALWLLKTLKPNVAGRQDCNNKYGTMENLQVRRLQLLRFWLLHSLSNIHSYFVRQVKQSHETELLSCLRRANSIQLLVQGHTSYLVGVHSLCLQDEQSEVILAAVLGLVGLTQTLGEVWKGGSNSISESRLCSAEELFTKCYFFLGATLLNVLECNLQCPGFSLPPDLISNFPCLLPRNVQNFARFSFAEVCWQSRPHSGISFLLPDYVVSFLKDQVTKGSLSSVSESEDVLKLFLDSFFEYLSFLRKRASEKLRLKDLGALSEEFISCAGEPLTLVTYEPDSVVKLFPHTCSEIGRRLYTQSSCSKVSQETDVDIVNYLSAKNTDTTECKRNISDMVELWVAETVKQNSLCQMPKRPSSAGSTKAKTKFAKQPELSSSDKDKLSHQEVEYLLSNLGRNIKCGDKPSTLSGFEISALEFPSPPVHFEEPHRKIRTKRKLKSRNSKSQVSLSYRKIEGPVLEQADFVIYNSYEKVSATELSEKCISEPTGVLREQFRECQIL